MKKGLLVLILIIGAINLCVVTENQYQNIGEETIYISEGYRMIPEDKILEIDMEYKPQEIGCDSLKPQINISNCYIESRDDQYLIPMIEVLNDSIYVNLHGYLIVPVEKYDLILKE